MAINVTHSKVSTIPDGDDSSLIRPSDWNDDHVLTGLGTMAEQNANSVAITGGTMSGVSITGYIPSTEKGAVNGVATLNSSGQVPLSQLPPLGELNYQGTWNATTNSPTLTSSVGTKGYYYVVSVAGTTNLNGITDWQIGDWAVFNGTAWQKVDNTDAVTSVNGQTGTVVLTTTNVAEGTNEYFTTARSRASVSAGTGISYDSGTGVITNSAPDQTVALTAGTGISTSGTYPNFTITNTAPSLGGDVVGPASATDNAIARFDTTTGKLLQNSVVTIGDTGAATGFTTLSASTSVTSPILKASNSAGGALQNASGTAQIQWGAGGGDNVAIDVSANLNGTNAQIDISPTGTGHVHIKPSGTNSVEIAPISVGTIDNMTIGATTAAAGSFTNLSVTGTTSFDGSQGTAGQVLTSAGTGATPIWTTPTTGTVTSVTGTAPVVSSGGNTPAISMAAATTSVDGYLTSTDWNTFNGKGSGTVTSVSGTGTVSGLTLSGTVTSSGSLTLGGTLAVAPSAVSDQSNTSTGYFDLPVGTTAQRPGSPNTGMIRYNTTTSAYEVYNGTSWVQLSTSPYTVSASYLSVAGGGGGGTYGGGGGAGGMLTGTTSLSIGTTYTVVIGAGGRGGSAAQGRQGVSGSNTTFTGLTATVGGGGGGDAWAGFTALNGGSGGGTAGYGNGSGTAGQGNNGGTSAYAGGGGAGAVGGNGVAGVAAGAGGIGASSSITGSAVFYAGGGGGSDYNGGGALGGLGGGGNGAGLANGGNGTANLGGGGGSCGQAYTAGSGGSGVFILSVPTVSYTGTTTGSPTVTTNGSDTVMTFTASGSYTA